jgi:hypothetical protein
MSSIPSKEQCEREHSRVKECLMENFVSNLKKHHEQGHKYLIQNSIHGVASKLILDKQLVIYLVLGSNSIRENWGNLKEKYGLEPIKYVLRKEVVQLVKENLENYGAKVYFGDMKGNGDFKMKVDFYPYTKKETSGETGESAPEKEEGFKPVRKTFKRKTYANAAKVPAIRNSKEKKPEPTTSE